MAAASYDRCLARLLVHEGGYTNHPSDPGGPTNFGITIYDYRKYVKPNATAADVRSMKLDEAKAIYRTKYWAARRCDDLPAGIDDTVFDYGVNSGIGRSGKVLRRVVGLPDNTSVVTDEVLAAVLKRDAKALIVAINDERLRFLKGLKTWPVFGAGWSRRVAEVKAFSLCLTEHPAVAQTPMQNPTQSPMPAETSSAKGIVPPPKAVKEVITKGVPAGGSVAGLGFVDWVVAHPIETAAIAALGAGAMSGALFAINHWHQAQQEAPTPNLIPLTT
jgi:lysozyme family protein